MLCKFGIYSCDNPVSGTKLSAVSLYTQHINIIFHFAELSNCYINIVLRVSKIGKIVNYSNLDFGLLHYVVSFQIFSDSYSSSCYVRTECLFTFEICDRF